MDQLEWPLRVLQRFLLSKFQNVIEKVLSWPFSTTRILMWRLQISRTDKKVHKSIENCSATQCRGNIISVQYFVRISKLCLLKIIDSNHICLPFYLICLPFNLICLTFHLFLSLLALFVYLFTSFVYVFTSFVYLFTSFVYVFDNLNHSELDNFQKWPSFVSIWIE